MEHLAAIMILIGCNGMTNCQQIPAPTVAYESPAECRSELKSAIMSAVKSAPEVYGTCTEVDPLELEQDVSIYWDLSKDGRIIVKIVNADEQMAPEDRVVASR